jgi:ABC-type branched-subunit amino acid transport system ATPase component
VTPDTLSVPDEALLRVEGLTVRFGGVVANDDITLWCREGNITALLGPNGAGKTTCFNAISGMQEISAGNITFAGRDITRQPAHRRARLGIGRTFQNVAVVPEMSLIENVMIGADRFRGYGAGAAACSLPWVRRTDRRIRLVAAAALGVVGLSEVGHLPASALPFGGLRRLELARALALGPRLLLLDEPGSGLDASASADLADALREMRSAWGVTILVVEHDLRFVRRVADDAFVLDFGQLLAGGPIEPVLHHPAVIQAYLGVHATT